MKFRLNLQEILKLFIDSYYFYLDKLLMPNNWFITLDKPYNERALSKNLRYKILCAQSKKKNLNIFMKCFKTLREWMKLNLSNQLESPTWTASEQSDFAGSSRDRRCGNKCRSPSELSRLWRRSTRASSHRVERWGFSAHRCRPADLRSPHRDAQYSRLGRSGR